MDRRVKIIGRYIGRYKPGYIIGLCALVVTDIFMLLRPRVIGNAIDSIPMPKPPHPLVWYVALFMGLVIVENIFRILWRFMLMGSSRKIERDLLNDFFSHLLRLDPRFYDRTPTGDLMARATNDVASIRMLLGPGIMALFDAVVVSTITLFFMLSVSPMLTLYALLPLPLLTLILSYLLRKVHNAYDKVQEQFSTISATAQESISGIRVVKAHNREEVETRNFDRVTTDYVHNYMYLTKFESGIEPVIVLTTGIGAVITLFAGGNAVIAGRISLGELVEFFLYLMMLTWPVIAVGWATNLWQRGFASLRRVQKIMEEQPTIDVPVQTTAVSFKEPHEKATIREDSSTEFESGDLYLRNVSFRYNPQGPDVLKNITLKIEQGSILGIVGPMGSGKTTLLNLIGRLYDPTEGQVLINGVDIREIPVYELREHIAFVFQEPFLFSRSLKENINLGLSHDSLNEEEIMQTLKLAALHHEVRRFSEGLDTRIGERGVTLSGGQKQRMTIARAMARDSSILILDDTLSSVDTDTEEKIIKNLRSYGKGRTNIIVSHRISSVKDADKIIVLINGEVVERGSHEQLLRNKGFYYRLYEQQRLQEKIEGM